MKSLLPDPSPGRSVAAILFLAIYCFFALSGFPGCRADTLVDFERGVVENAKGIIRQENGFDPPLYVIGIPDMNSGTGFVLNGLPEFLPPDNLPPAFQKDGIRVVVSGKIVETPPQIRLPAMPLRITSIRALD